MDSVIGDSNSDIVVLDGFHGPRCRQNISDEQRAQVATQVITFRQIVYHLDENPSYSAGIRGLTVRLLCLEGTPAQEEKTVNAFRDLVLCIIEYLPNLKMFRWATCDGVVPLADEIVDALIARKVEQFFMPVTRIGDSDLSRLRGLNTLSLGLQWHERTEGFGFYYNHTDAFAEWQAVIVTENASTIQHLAVTASIRWQCDLPALREAVECQSCHHGQTVEDVTSSHQPHTHRDGVQRSQTHPFGDGIRGIQAIAMFLKNKALLRRLHVVLSSGHRSLYRSILEVLPTLPSLEVLDVQLNCDTLDADELRFYDVYLPRALTSLLVLARFGTVKVSPEELLSIFTARAQLKTLTLAPVTERTFRSLDDALNPLLFDNRPPSLEFLEWAHCTEGRNPDRSRTLVGFCPGPEKHNIFCSASRGSRPFARKPFPTNAAWKTGRGSVNMTR